MRRFELWWVSAHPQGGELLMGSYASERAAREAVPEQLAELLSQCGVGAHGEQSRRAIQAGNWVCKEVQS